MKFIKIPRGTIYQKISDQIVDLLCIIFTPLNNQKKIKKFEKKFERQKNSNTQLQTRSKSCKLTRWQPRYNHQRSHNCLARLDF